MNTQTLHWCESLPYMNECERNMCRGWKLLSRAMKNSTKSENHEDKILRRPNVSLRIYTSQATMQSVAFAAAMNAMKAKGRKSDGACEWHLYGVCVVAAVKWNFTSFTLSFTATWKVSLCGARLYSLRQNHNSEFVLRMEPAFQLAFAGIKKQSIALWILIQIW